MWYMALRNKELRINKMVAASMRLFSQKGFYSTSVDDIVREAGVGKGTFYRYFKSKEDIFITTLIQFLTEWGQSVLIGVDKVRPEQYLDYVKGVARESFRFFTQNIELSNLYSRVAPGLNEVIEPHIKEFEDLMLGYLEQDLEKAQKMGYLENNLNLKLTANIISGAFFRVIYYYFLMKTEDRAPVQLNEVVDQFVHTIFQSILKKERDA